jgi:hypothetical protein
MGNYEELNPMINSIIEYIGSSQNLLRYIKYTETTNPLDSSLPDLTIGNVMMANLYPLPKIPEAETDANCMVTITIDSRPNNINTRTRQDVITFGVIAHVDSWMIDGGLRPFYIVSEIDKLFNDKKFKIKNSDKVLGYNTLTNLGMKGDKFAEKFYGYWLSYKIDNNNNMGTNY